MMNKKNIKLLISAALISCTGCGMLFLPAGTPPEGNIVENMQTDTTKFSSRAEAIDHFISALSFVLLEKCPGKKIRINANSESFDTACRILHESSKLTGNTVTYADSPWEIKAVSETEQIILSLSYRGTPVWEEKVSVTEK